MTGADDIFVMLMKNLCGMYRFLVWKTVLMALMNNLVMECVLCYEVRTGTDDGTDETFWNIT